jgi:hypothetical protein
MLKKRLKPILSIEGIIEGSLARGIGGSFAGAAGTHRPTGGFVRTAEKRRSGGTRRRLIGLDSKS